MSDIVLETLDSQYGPLCPDVCEWLQQLHQVTTNGSWCANVSSAALPQDVCDTLANQSLRLSGCTRCLPRAPTLDRDDVIRATLLGLLALLSCVGNLYTIYSIRSKASPAMVYKLLLHLSVADVVVAVVCIAGEAIWMLLVQWPFGNAACKTFKFIQMTALHGSSYVVVLIAQNRWVAVSHPLATRRHASSLCVTPRSVVFVWTVGACLSTPQLFIFSVKEGPFYEPYFQCVTYDVSAESERLYNIINFITLFFIPLLGLIASYLSIYCTLSRGRSEMRMMSEMSVSMTHNRQRSMKRAMVKSRWIAVVIVCAYIVFWLPYYGTMLVYFLSPGQWYDSKWMDWIFFFGMANSVVNPLVYGMFQLWKPKRRKRWSCFRPREGSTQLSHLTIQESFRRTKSHKLSPSGSVRGSLPPSPVEVALSALPDVRRAQSAPSAETSQRTLTVKPANLSWRARVLRKYRTLRASSNQTHI